MCRSRFAVVAIAATAALFASACNLGDPYYTGGELEVRWSIDGSRSRSLCTTYGIDSWIIGVTGSTNGSTEVDCNQGWGVLIYDLNPGAHQVALRAVDFGGRTLATKTASARVSSFDYDLLEIGLSKADFNGSSDDKADLEVGWSVDGKKLVGSCTTFGIARWHIKVAGPETKEVDVACGSAWVSNKSFYGLKPGNYEVSVEAFDAAEGGTRLAQRSKTVKLAHDPSTIWTVDHAFVASDFKKAPPPPKDKGTLAVSWTINGTVDGAPLGQSWDGCADVGATQVELDLDGTKKTFPCDDKGKMGTSFADLDVGSHKVAVTLLDDKGSALTSADGGTVEVKKDATATLVIDFAYGEFVKAVRDTIKGDFIFRTTFAGKTCADAGAGRQVVLLQADGTPVSGAKVCDASKTTCGPADGASFADCQPSFATWVIPDLPWGKYTLKISGSKSGAADVCWQTSDGKGGSEISILVGAGTKNPVVTIDLPRVSTTGACQ